MKPLFLFQFPGSVLSWFIAQREENAQLACPKSPTTSRTCFCFLLKLAQSYRVQTHTSICATDNKRLQVISKGKEKAKSLISKFIYYIQVFAYILTLTVFFNLPALFPPKEALTSKAITHTLKFYHIFNGKEELVNVMQAWPEVDKFY